MRENDLEEKSRLLDLLFKIGRGAIKVPLQVTDAIIHQLGTVRKRLGERT
jgi:hypothetical protein